MISHKRMIPRSSFGTCFNLQTPSFQHVNSRPSYLYYGNLYTRTWTLKRPQCYLGQLAAVTVTRYVYVRISVSVGFSSRGRHDKSIETACTYRVCLTAWSRPVSIHGIRWTEWLNNYTVFPPKIVRVRYGGFQIPTHVLPSSQSCWMQYDIIYVDLVIKRGGCINSLLLWF